MHHSLSKLLFSLCVAAFLTMPAYAQSIFGGAKIGGVLGDAGGKISNAGKNVSGQIAKLDPTTIARKELEKLQREALSSLRKMDPNWAMKKVEEGLQKQLHGELRRGQYPFNPQTGIIDLRKSPMSRYLESVMKTFAQGNERASGVDRFEYDLYQDQLHVASFSRHKHIADVSLLGRQTIYDVTQRLKLTVDFKKHEGSIDLDLGPLAPRVSQKGMRALQKGDLATAAEEMAPRLPSHMVRKDYRDDYSKWVNQLRSRYGHGVYCSSKAFVDWATPETAGRYALNSITTAGASVQRQVMHDVQERANAESPGLIMWLRQRGIENAEELTIQLLTGKTPSIPHVQVRFFPVKYSSRETILNRTSTPWRDVNHLGFAIVFTK